MNELQLLLKHDRKFPIGKVDYLIRLQNNNLQQVERLINSMVKDLALKKLLICIALANIKKKQLYVQNGLSSFKEYLEAKRIDIHYHTACEYAKIGEIYLKYEGYLKKIQFKEEDGLKKLLLLEIALKNNTLNREIVFAKLIESSFRNFKSYIKKSLQTARADSEFADQSIGMGTNISFVETDECIIIMPYDKEILWFDFDLDKYLQSSGMAKKFKKYISKAVKNFFIESLAEIQNSDNIDK